MKQWEEEYLHDLSKIPTKICVTSSTDKKEENGFIFVQSPREAIELLRKKGNDNVLVSGGATINSAFAREGLIDEVIFNIEPHIIGKGIPVFKPEEFDMKLESTAIDKKPSGIVQLRYKVIH